MDERLGKNIYWTATVIAVLIVAVVVIGYVSNSSEGRPIIPIPPLLIAGAIWLAGWAIRHLLARR